LSRRRNPGAAFPDFAEFIIGPAFGLTRWLNPGYGGDDIEPPAVRGY
jgi:hypothetical protein